MKHLNLWLLCAAIILFTPAFSQTDSSGYYDSIPRMDPKVIMDSIYSNVDTTEITSGILLDKGLADLDPSGFTGTNVETDAEGTYNRYFKLYGEIRDSRMSNSTLNMPDYDNLLDRIVAHNGDDHISIGVLYFNYNRITEDESEDYFFLTGGKLVDNPNRTQSPYEQHSFFCASSVRYESLTGKVNFIMPTDLFFGNVANIGSFSFEADFDDGNGYISIFPDSVYVVEYDSAGEKEITIRLTNGNTVLNSKFKMKIMNGVDAPSTVTTIASWIDPVSGTAEARVYLANGHTHIEKAFIMCEGLDPLDEFNLDYLQRLINTRPLGNNGFIDQITDLGYDFIILNFRRTGGYAIEYNAEVLRRLIKDCITNGSSENIVGGVSMGGLVARMCLAKMEKEYCEDHKTVMYISYDSPHKGANVPLGLQYLADEMDRTTLTAIGELHRRRYMLNCVAAKQMLISHFSAWGNPSTLHIDFQNALNTLNYPEKCRRIAVSLGNSSNNLFSATIYPLIHGSAYSAASEILNIYDNGNLYKNVHAYATNPYFVSDVLRLHLAWRPRIWRFRLSNEDIVNTRYFYGAGLGYDYSPGGFISTQREIADAFNDYSGNTAHTNWRDQHCIVPYNSSVDLKCNNCSTLVQNQNSGYFISNHLTPFDNIFSYDPSGITPFNYRHDGVLTPDAFNFLVNEVINHINNTSSPANSHLSSTLTITYNFGTAYHNTIESVSINSGGLLQVNGNYATDFGNGPTPSGSSSPYVLTTSSCLTDVVTIASGGELEIGDASSSTHKGNLIFTDESKIEIQNGGTLTINNGSKLVIKPGATFVYQEGATINLVGSNSILEIQGELILGNNANFTITGSGYIKFSLPDGTTAQSIPITASNSNCTFVLSTNNQTNKVMEVTKGWVTPSSNLSLFKIYKGTVELGTDVYLNLGCKTELNNTTVTSTGANGYIHNGVKLGNQNVSDITIRYCNFFKAKIGIWWGSTGTGTLTILGTQFQNCDKALHTVGNGVDIKNVRFIECNTAAWLAESMTGLSDFSGYVEDCANGLVYSGSTGANLFITTTQFNTNTFSVIADGDITITSKCSKYEGNVSDFVLSDGCTLNLSTTQTVTRIGSGLPSNQDAGGNNKFINSSSEVVYATDIYDILLDEGYNSFTYSGTPGTILFGSLSNSFYSNSNNHLDVTDNYWSLYAWVGTPSPSLTLIHYPTSSNIELEYSANNNDIAFDYSPELVSAPSNCSAWNGEITEEESDPEGVRQGDGTGVKSVADLMNRFSVYPNPASNKLNFTVNDGNFSGTLSLIDVTGRIVPLQLISQQNQNKFEYDLSSLSAGIYQAVVLQDGAVVYKTKLSVLK